MSDHYGNDNDTTPASPLFKRAKPTSSTSVGWQTALVSLPRGLVFKALKSGSFLPDANQAEPYFFYYDNSAGAGQTVYVSYEDGIWTNHKEFTKNFQGSLVQLESNKYNVPDGESPKQDIYHRSGVAAQINGATLGGCKKCQLVYFKTYR